MREGYLVVDGERINISTEDTEYLMEKYSDNEVFDIKEGKTYWYIDSCGNVKKDKKQKYDNLCYSRELVGNACTRNSILTYRSEWEALNRLLWKFSYEHGWDITNFEELDIIYFLSYDIETDSYMLGSTNSGRILGAVYFANADVASQAIEEVVKPFFKSHADMKNVQ